VSYDTWLQSPYMREIAAPLHCTGCGEHVFKNVEDRHGQAHCVDEDSGETVGILEYDEGFDWSDLDPRIP